MLAKGADPSVRMASGWTPLMCAIYMGHTRFVLLLLGNGANMFTRAAHHAFPTRTFSIAEHVQRLLVSRGLCQQTLEEVLEANRAPGGGWTGITYTTVLEPQSNHNVTRHAFLKLDSMPTNVNAFDVALGVGCAAMLALLFDAEKSAPTTGGAFRTYKECITSSATVAAHCCCQLMEHAMCQSPAAAADLLTPGAAAPGVKGEEYRIKSVGEDQPHSTSAVASGRARRVAGAKEPPTPTMNLSINPIP